MALSKENGNERVRQIIQPPKIIKPFVPITIAPPVKFSPKTIFTKTEGSTRDSPESEFKGTYGKGKRGCGFFVENICYEKDLFWAGEWAFCVRCFAW